MNLFNRSLKKLLRLFIHKDYLRFPWSKTINISKDLTTGKLISINIPKNNVTIKIERNVSLREFCTILVFPGASLTIGQNVFFNNYCAINCLDKITIGENTLFGEGVKMYDHNHLYEMGERLIVERSKFSTGSITIGSNCWIGSNVTILKGVAIGDNVIIGANNLIYRSIAANSVVKANFSTSIQTLK